MGERRCRAAEIAVVSASKTHNKSRHNHTKHKVHECRFIRCWIVVLLLIVLVFVTAFMIAFYSQLTTTQDSLPPAVDSIHPQPYV